MNTELIIRSILLGIGLAMDAFSVSLADGLAERDMKVPRRFTIAGTFAVYQFVMPMIGWMLVKTAVNTFASLEKAIPWIALILLLYIGGKMLKEGSEELRGNGSRGENSAGEEPGMSQSISEAGCIETGHITEEMAGNAARLTFGALMLQGIATSIDALSVGFTIENYGLLTALASSLMIGTVTLIICLLGLALGRAIGTRLSGKAGMLGGVILILIGIEIWIKGFLL